MSLKALNIFVINDRYQHYHHHIIITVLSELQETWSFCLQNFEVLV